MTIDSVMPVFWSYVTIGDGCWEWGGNITNKSYGQIWCGKMIGAHRLSLIWSSGSDRPGMVACHTCDRPPCVRPSHLFWGTNSENMKDMIRKGRRFDNSGESHAMHKLDGAGVLKIRDALASGCKISHVAAEFGVSPRTIALIRDGKRWKNLLQKIER